MKFRKKPNEPLLFETFGEYNPDGIAIRNLINKVHDLDFQKNAGEITEQDWENEMKLLYNTVAELEKKYATENL